MYIAVDFDGTCCKHAFPEIGEDIGAAKALRCLVEDGHKIILYTMRSHPIQGQSDEFLLNKGLTPIDKNRDTLQEAIDWFNKNGIELYAINDNPTQHSWTQSTKVLADYYIDDRAVGVPLWFEKGERPYVNWGGVMFKLFAYGAITEKTYEKFTKKWNS